MYIFFILQQAVNKAIKKLKEYYIKTDASVYTIATGKLRNCY